MVNHLSKQPLNEVLEKYGLQYLAKDMPAKLPDISHLASNDRIALAIKLLRPLSQKEQEDFAHRFADEADTLESLETITDALYSMLATKKGLNHSVKTFVGTSTNAMVRLQEAGKPNIVLKLAEVIYPPETRSLHPLMPMDRMPFGLVQYQIEFFHSYNSDQVHGIMLSVDI